MKRLKFQAGILGAHSLTLAFLKRALEKAGVEFTNGDQPGVRLRSANQERQITKHARLYPSVVEDFRSVEVDLFRTQRAAIVWLAFAAMLQLSFTPRPATAAIIVVCGPPAPHGNECCLVMHQIYWKGYGQL